MARLVKRVLTCIGILFALVPFLLVGVVYYAKTDHALHLMQVKVNESIPGTISLEDFRFSLLKGEFEFKNMLLKGPSNDELAGFNSLFVEISWTSLFRGKLTVAALILEKPWATLRVDSEGGINLMDAFPPSSSQEKPDGEKGKGIPINIVLDSLKLVQGSICYEMVTEDLKAVAADIDLTASGDLLEQSGNLTVQIGKATLDSPKIITELDHFKLEATLKEGRIDPLFFHAGTTSSRLTISGNIGDVLSNPFLDLTLDTVASLPEVRKALCMEPMLTGQLATQLTARGTLDNPDVTCRFAYGGGILSGQQVDGIDLDCRLKNRLLTLNSLHMNVASGDLNLQGELDLQDAFVNGFLDPQRDLEAISYKILLEEKGIRLEELLPATNELRGTVASNLCLSGNGISPETLSARLTLGAFAEELATNHLSAPIQFHLEAEANVNQGVAALEHLKASAGDIGLAAEGHLNVSSEQMTARLTLDAPSLTTSLAALGINGVSGAIGLTADVSGTIKEPVLGLLLAGDQLGFKDVTIGDVRLDAAMDQSGRLQISKLDLRNKRSAICITGDAQVLQQGIREPLKDPSFRVDLQGDAIFIEDFIKAGKGEVSLNAHFAGRMTQPEGTLSLHGRRLELGTQKIDEVKLITKLDGEKISINPLQIVVASGELIEAAGWLSLQKAYQIAIVSDGISLHHIDRIRELGIAEGKIFLNVSGEGTLEDPKITGEIALKHLRINEKPLKDVQLHLDLHNQLARISGNLNFDVNASFDLKKKDFLASILFDETDLTPYFKIANQPDLTGTLSGQIEARGNTEEIDRTQASVSFSKLNVFFKDNQFIHSQDFKASIQGKEITIPAIHLLLPKEGRIDINGKGKLDGPLDLRVECDIPLRMASLFVEDLDDITGNIALSAGIGGTGSHPEINGEIGLHEIALTVPELLQRLHDLNGRIQITPQAITIHEIKGGLDSGRFDLAGKIDLEGFQPTKALVKVSAKALPLRVPETLDMLLTTQIELEGTEKKSMIRGETTILEGTYYKDVNLSLFQMVKKKKREEAPPAAEITQPFLKNMGLDVTVSCRNPFVVDNNLANLDIRPDLRITGKLGNPIISGRTEIESGTIFYRKKSFVVTKGVIDFLNPYKTEPTLDITSEVKIRKWTIFLEISGTPDEIVFKTTSDPPEEDEDILSLLLFGKTTRELIAGEGGTSQNTEQMVAELIANTFGGDIKAATGLDILEVETLGEEDEEASDQIKVTVGKRLSKRMTVKYAVESEGGELVQRAIAEYKLLENILLNGFQGTDDIFGGELQFRLDFR
ncbi:MAG: hypothetical protein BA872_09550 [Desulfobacterales bacterium C00003060]|nr:MAG: hypothetical protein BA872_09550 [Desulfobacterales bacterium C00003060]